MSPALYLRSAVPLTRLVTWGGYDLLLAASLAMVSSVGIWVATTFLDGDRARLGLMLGQAAIVASLLMTLLGLIGVYLRQADRVAVVGALGFLAAFVGTVALLLQSALGFLQTLTSLGPVSVPYVDPLVAATLLDLILLLLGAAGIAGYLALAATSIAYRTLPTATFLILLLGAVGAFLPPSTTGTLVHSLALLLWAAALLSLGTILIRSPRLDSANGSPSA